MNKLNSIFPITLFVFGIFIGCNQKTINKEADIEAINQMFTGYCHYVKIKDLDSLMTLFTDDAKRSAPGIPTIVGKENLRAALKSIIEMGDHTITPYGEPDVDFCENIGYYYYTVIISTIPSEGGPAQQIDVKGLSIFKKQDDGSWKTYIDCLNIQPILASDSIEPDLLEEPNPYY